MEQLVTRKGIIESLVSGRVLAIYDPFLPIEEHTDASSISYRVVLL